MKRRQRQQGLAVLLLLLFTERSDHRFVARQLAAAGNLLPQPGHKGIEPMERSGRHGKPFINQIPAAQMGQLMAQDIFQLPGIDLGIGQNDPRAQQTHQHGRTRQRTAAGRHSCPFPQNVQQRLLVLPQGRAARLQPAAKPQITEGKPQKMHQRTAQPKGSEVVAEKIPDLLMPGLGCRHNDGGLRNDRSGPDHQLPLVVGSAGRQLILRLLNGC